MRVFTYRMKFDSEWIDVTSLINSESTTIKNALCTKDFKSVTNSCSFTLLPSNSLFYAQIVDKIIKARSAKTDVHIEISDVKTGTILFGGTLDSSSLTISSSRMPESVEIEGQDYIAMWLDKKINLNLVYEDLQVSAIVVRLLEAAGINQDYVDVDVSLLSEKCKYFVTTDDDDTTYRDVIDTLLYEVPGYVLYRNPANSHFEVKKIVPDAEPTRRVSYMVSAKLSTETSIFDEDGIKVTYPTIDTQKARPVYVESLTESNPAEIPSQHYYPENGDIQVTYQEYNKNLLDRDYNTSVTRTQNSDLDILFVKNPKINIYPKDDSWDFPVLSSLDMPSNPVWYPRKAWVLIRNKTDETKNLSLFDIEGDVVYKSKINNITLPATATDPDEYESSYIFDEEHASKFAKWYYGMKTISSTTTTWTEPVLYSYVGEKVIVEHKDSSISQGHVVVQINNVSLDGGVRGYKVTAVAVSDFSEYEYSKDVRINGSSNKSIYREYTEYYNSTSYTELIGGEWSSTLSIDPDKILWTRRVVLYLDGTSYYSTPAPSGAKGADGKPGESGSYLSFDISRTLIDYYADDVPVDNSVIAFTAKSDLNVTISIDGKAVTDSKPSVYYEIAPTSLLAGKNSILATAATNKMQQTQSVAKNILTGSLSLTADKTSIAYYADNVAHDTADKIVLTVESSNYKHAPKLYLDNELQTTEDNASYTYSVPASAFAEKNIIIAKVTAGNDSQTITLSKTMDTGAISISSDKSDMLYYADNEPTNASDKATVQVYQTGYSKLPKLTINGIETSYTSTYLTESATYVIKAEDLKNTDQITAEISIVKEVQSVTVSKKWMQATIELSLSESVAEYYADNVAITGNIIATVNYDGLFYPPLLKAGDTSIVLDDTGKGEIPISLFDNASNGLIVTAYAQRYISYSQSVNVPKITRPLVLSLGNSGSQFSYNSEGVASPQSITITNYTTGLSDISKVTLVVGGAMKSWSNNQYTITPEMIIGRYLAVTISYGSESSSLIITKTYDGKAETIQYSKTKSFKIYPNEEYTFVYSDEGVTYNGETMAWCISWSEKQPDISSNEYLWRRSRASETDSWQYTRLTGLKGEDGKAGEYIGHYVSAPNFRPDGDEIKDGDYYLNISVEGSPVPYIYRNGAWQIVTKDSANWSQIASSTMADVNDYGGALLSTSAYFAFFQALSAQNAFIESLGTREITLNNGGSIESQNYKDTNGAEGFRINADGTADFSEGTWRGSFANGMSFIPPTQLSIKKTMTQKEAYRALKKAGVVEGIYRVNDMYDYYNTGLSSGIMMIGIYDSPVRTGAGFTCTDYDSLDMQTPLLSTFTGLIPLGSEYMIAIDASDTEKKAYLVTKSMLAKSQWTVEGYDSDKGWTEDSNLRAYPLSDWESRIVKLNDSSYTIYGTAIDGKLILKESDDTFGLYGVSGMSLSKLGSINLPASHGFLRWIIPAFYIHKQNGSYYGSCMNGDLSHYSIVRSTDLLNYEIVATIETSYSTNVIPMDIVYVNNRIFAQVCETVSDKEYLLYFAEYNSSTQKWDCLPDYYTVHSATDSSAAYALPSLYIRDNVIYGTYSKHEFFVYNTSTNEYKCLTRKMGCALVTGDVYGGYATMNATQPPIYAHRGSNYSKYEEWNSLEITALDYSESLGGIMLVCRNAEASYYSSLLYDIDTDTAKALSPLTFNTRDSESSLLPLCQFTETDGEYLSVIGRTVLASSVADSDKPSFRVNNIHLEDLMDYYNGVKTIENIMFPEPANVPLLYKLYAKNFADGVKTALTMRDDPSTREDAWINWHYDGERMIRNADETFTVNSVSPFFNIGQMVIRETETSYDIYMTEDYQKMFINSCPAILPAFWARSYYLDPLLEGVTGGARYALNPNSNMIPILSIDKDSDELMTASFTWDFPAQFTVAENYISVATNKALRRVHMATT